MSPDFVVAAIMTVVGLTTPILHRFGFRDVIRVNGTLHVACLVACGWLSPAVPVAIVYPWTPSSGSTPIAFAADLLPIVPSLFSLA